MKTQGKDLERHRRALADVSRNEDFLAYLEAMLERVKTALLSAEGSEVHRLQGRGRALTDLISDLKRSRA